MTTETISQLPAASSVSSSDLVAVTQGSTGAGTGVTRSATMGQYMASGGGGVDLTDTVTVYSSGTVDLHGSHFVPTGESTQTAMSGGLHNITPGVPTVTGYSSVNIDGTHGTLTQTSSGIVTIKSLGTSGGTLVGLVLPSSLSSSGTAVLCQFTGFPVSGTSDAVAFGVQSSLSNAYDVVLVSQASVVHATFTNSLGGGASYGTPVAVALSGEFWLLCTMASGYYDVYYSTDGVNWVSIGTGGNASGDLGVFLGLCSRTASVSFLTIRCLDLNAGSRTFP